MAVRAFLGLILAGIVTGQLVDVTPEEAVRRVGDDVTILCKVAYVIDYCSVTVGKISYRLLPSNQDGNVVYSGKGLEHGECGAHIKSITNESNGEVTCVLPPKTGNIEVRGKMNLIVASPPGHPQLLPIEQHTFKEGETLQAQCVVPRGRPAAKITWLLDENVLLDGIHHPVLTADPQGSDFTTISQNVTRLLTADDSNKNLICKAEHEAMDQPRFASKQIQVHYAPKRQESGTITIFGLKLSSDGKLNVTVRANPPPNVEWTVGDQRLVPTGINDQATIIALEPLALGNGYYNCTLLIRQISKEDVERTYYLRVYNDVGHEEFAVRLSTMDEPAGVELSAGAIVGIVIAVLVLLIAVFLVVFAKATDRWCFGAARRDNIKSSGESSDTESAVGGRQERSRLAELSARVRAVFPKSKDKVQATETAAESDDKPHDEKKNVVYAELALGEGARDKPPPVSTEYAQIVYTAQEPTAQTENKDA